MPTPLKDKEQAMSEYKDQDPVITLCAELEEQHPGFGFGRAAKEILKEREAEPWAKQK